MGCRSNDVHPTLLLKPCHVMVTWSNPKNEKNHHPKTHPVMKVLQVVSFLEFWPLRYWYDWMKLSKRRPIWAWLLIPTVGPGPSIVKKYPSHYSELFLSLNWYDFSVSAKWGICIKDHWPYVNQDQDAKPQSGASSLTKAPNQDIKDMDVLCTLKIKIESQNSELWSTRD